MFSSHTNNRGRAVGAAMAHVRKRLCLRLHELMTGSEEHFVAGWTPFLAEVEAGFRQEESIMETLRYPGLQRHRADNALALRALHRITLQVEAGDTTLGRQALAALGDILSLHRLTAGVALTGPPARPATMPGRFKAGIGRRAVPEHVAAAGHQRHHRH
ncbi:hypothetical protein [Massilia niabensis]|uniref:Hemerythrin-like domain-containing protein n=1 Tax=Massilia niabensis TaxID=544910 RepID=A0ABW0LAP1_9BURK